MYHYFSVHTHYPQGCLVHYLHNKDEFWVVKVCEILRFSSCALPELGRASATNVNKFMNFEYCRLFSVQYQDIFSKGKLRDVKRTFLKGSKMVQRLKWKEMGNHNFSIQSIMYLASGSETQQWMPLRPEYTQRRCLKPKSCLRALRDHSYMTFAVGGEEGG